MLQNDRETREREARERTRVLVHGESSAGAAARRRAGEFGFGLTAFTAERVAAVAEKTRFEDVRRDDERDDDGEDDVQDE